VATGLPLFGSFSGGPDIVNNADLNVHYEIPIREKSGLVPFYYILTYDSSVWHPVGTSGSQTWQFAPNMGWRVLTPVVTGSVTFSETQQSCFDRAGNMYYYNRYSNFSYTDPRGTVHPAPSTFYVSDRYLVASQCRGGLPSAAQAIIQDGYGYTINANIDRNDHDTTDYYPAVTLDTRSGGVISPTIAPYEPNPQSPSVTDNDGNLISVSTSSGTTTYTDSLNTTALSVSGSGIPASPQTLTYADPNGNVSAYVKYASYNIKTNFGCSGIADTSFAWSLVSEIDLADGSKYTFGYEATPGYSGYVTGRLASVTLPTGGAISYQYEGSNNGIVCADGSTATLWRSTPDTGSSYWQYAHSENGSAWTTNITAPPDSQGNQAYTTLSFQGIYETARNVYQAQGGTLLQTVNTCYNGATIPCTGTVVSLPISNRTVEVTFPNLSPSETYATYNTYGLPTEVDEYNFGPTLVRKTVTAYDYNTSCGVTNTLVVDKPCSVTVENASGTAVASTTYAYDGNGNTLSITSGGLTRSYAYNSNGAVHTATDANSNQTLYTYGSGSCNGAFPIIVSPPLIPSTSATWNCSGGLMASSADANGQTTTYTYNDPLWRLTGISLPDGGGTTINYTSSTVRDALTNVFGSTQRHDQFDLDGLGRLETTSLVNDPDGQTYQGTSYDALGRVLSVSNPYRGSSGGGDTYQYDALGRVTKATHADNSYLQIAYAPASASQGCSASNYGYGYPVLYTDETGNEWQTFTDALGRVIEADEPTSSSNTLSVYTCYRYDVLNDLTEVDQGSETRYYQYDALSRLTQAATPESKGNWRYFYYTTSGGALCAGDPGALCRLTDERGITTTYSYDALNRLTGTTYSNGEASVGYSYDQTSYNGLTIVNGKGRRTGMSDASGQTAWSYDKMGRVAAEQRTIGSVTKTLGYGYNLDGSLASVTYPSGRTVNYAASAVGRPLTAIDTADNIIYVGSANATYAPQGALATAAYGANISLSASYNNRLLPSNLEGYTSSATIFQLQPAYNPNGTVSSVTNGVNSARTQTFTYDYLNRITSASSAATSGTYCWGQSIPTNGTGYDRYGNLLIVNNTGTGSGCWSLPVLSVSVNTYNQITNSGFSYDAAGNMTGDGSYSYAWNGEGLLKSAGTTTYTYDGDKKRVEKSSGTYYWLSPSGSVLAETDTGGNTQNEYIYFNGGRTARRDSSGSVYYYFQDQIGSSRLIANSSGTVCYDADYTPFGYEMAYITTCSQNYKFTGLERDSETGNDHAWFRSYEQNLGRWMSPDPVAGDVTNPQSLNLYAYALNSPCSLTDPLGLQSCSFNIAIALGSLNAGQLSALRSELSRLFGAAGLGVNFVSGNQSPDYLLSVASAGGEPSWVMGQTFTNSSGTAYNVGYAYYNNVSSALSSYGVAPNSPLLGTALGQVAGHEFGHYAFQMPDVYYNPATTEESAGIMYFFDPANVVNGTPLNFTQYQVPALRGFCSRLHPRPTAPGPLGGSAGGSGGLTGLIGPMYDNYGNSNEAVWLVEYVYWVEGGGGDPSLGSKMPPPKSF
jgi:RHS repeat-associated protein